MPSDAADQRRASRLRAQAYDVDADVPANRPALQAFYALSLHLQFAHLSVLIPLGCKVCDNDVPERSKDRSKPYHCACSGKALSRRTSGACLCIVVQLLGIVGRNACYQRPLCATREAL